MITVKVRYFDLSTIEVVVDEICQLCSPVVFLWYIGVYGLKKSGVEFYQKSLISPILNRSKSVVFELVDLTAWGAVKDGRDDIRRVSPFCQVIEEMMHSQLRCIKSAEIFSQMQAITEKGVVEYFKEALERPFIRRMSEGVNPSKIKVSEIFDNKCPVLERFYDWDTAKAYSTLQYLEGCLLVKDIVNRTCRNAEIVFAVPNEEEKFYRDETGAFEKDVEFLLNHSQGMAVTGNVNIYFLSYGYGKNISDRPYNHPGKVFKKNEFTSNDIYKNRTRAMIG
jgi:hypothetical protein